MERGGNGAGAGIRTPAVQGAKEVAAAAGPQASGCAGFQRLQDQRVLRLGIHWVRSPLCLTPPPSPEPRKDW